MNFLTVISKAAPCCKSMHDVIKSSLVEHDEMSDLTYNERQGRFYKTGQQSSHLHCCRCLEIYDPFCYFCILS